MGVLVNSAIEEGAHVTGVITERLRQESSTPQFINDRNISNYAIS